MTPLDLNRIASAYGGTITGKSVVIPTPGHSRRDRGTIITPMPGAPDGALVHAYNGGQTEALAVKEMLRRDGFLPENGQRKRALTPAERRAIAARIRDIEAERDRQHRQAAGYALDLWQRGYRADPDHPYLARKRLDNFGVRQCGGDLLVPMVDGKFQLWNIQRIGPDGFKLFMKGGKTTGLFWPYRVKADPRPIVIAEGYATAAAIHEATNLGVVAAMTGQNLKQVAETMRALFPARCIIIAADWDGHLPINKGLASAQAAAGAVRGPVADERQSASRSAKIDFADIPRGDAAKLIRASLPMEAR